MTGVHRRWTDDLNRLFHPDPDERRRRERALLDIAADTVGITVPFLLGGAVLWAMGTMAVGFNAGFF